jgi:hypothetical protein
VSGLKQLRSMKLKASTTTPRFEVLLATADARSTSFMINVSKLR